MARLTIGPDDDVARWVARRCPGIGDFGQCRAFGLVRDGRLVGGVVFNQYSGHDIEISVALDDPRAVSRGAFAAIAHYVFVQCGCSRMTARTRRSNTRARRCLEKLGFSPEGELAKFYGDENCIIYGMTDEECRWLEIDHGKRTQSPAAA